MKNGDKPVYPVSDDPEYFKAHQDWFYGLTKRELASFIALNGILSNKAMIDTVDDDSLKWAGKTAIRQADIILSELEKTETP